MNTVKHLTQQQKQQASQQTSYILVIRLLCIFFGTCLSASDTWAQQLKPGFDKAEFIELLRVSAMQLDSTLRTGIRPPSKYTHRYSSPVTGLDNRWELWASQQGTAVISIRGTTASNISWLENFYAAMVPATGELQLDKQTTFTYRLAENPKAAVHTGWLVGMAFLWQSMLPKLDSCYRAGIKDLYIIGHSQGGAIAYLLTSHIKALQKQQLLPADLRLKTYCSAAPKPGNLYYAYEYEAATQSGWAFNVVNTADWVPETPISVQTLNDFNTTNPFTDARSMLRKQAFPSNLALGYVYNRLSKPTRKAQKNYQKYLGNLLTRQVQKHLQEFGRPDFYDSNHYTRAGNMVVLLADEAYYKRYPNDKEKLFQHHNFAPYLYLAQRLPEEPTP